MDTNAQESPEMSIAQLNRLDLPEFYFNGFNVHIGVGDVAIVLHRRGEPTVVLETSFTVAKSLAEALGALMGEFERVTSNQIMTTSYVEQKLRDAYAGDTRNQSSSGI
jgi:hypothetical protein